MRIKLLLNIGVPDARRLGLTKTLADDVVDVKDDAAKELITRGWGTDRLDEAKPSPAARPMNSSETPDPSAAPGPGPKGKPNA